MIVKADAVIADAETILGWIDIGEAFDVAFLREQEAGERFQQANRGLPVNRAHIGTGQRGPFYFLSHCLQPRLLAIAVGWIRRKSHPPKVVHGESEIGQHLLVRNRLVVLPRLLGLGYGAFLVGGNRFILRRRIREFARERIEHNLHQMDDGGDLLVRQVVEQLLRVGSIGVHVRPQALRAVCAAAPSTKVSMVRANTVC